MRPDEQARREQQSAEARGAAAPEAQRLPVTILEQRTYVTFFTLPVEALPDGSKTLRFLAPDGRLHVWALGEQQARDLGQQLVAPSVQIAAADEMPRNGHKPGGASR